MTYSVEELLNMKKTDFEEAMKVNTNTLGELESIRKYLTLQYERAEKLIKDLNNTVEKTEEVNTTIEQLAAVMISLEYKCSLIYQRVEKLKVESGV